LDVALAERQDEKEAKTFVAFELLSCTILKKDQKVPQTDGFAPRETFARPHP